MAVAVGVAHTQAHAGEGDVPPGQPVVDREDPFPVPQELARPVPAEVVDGEQLGVAVALEVEPGPHEDVAVLHAGGQPVGDVGKGAVAQVLVQVGRVAHLEGIAVVDVGLGRLHAVVADEEVEIVVAIDVGPGARQAPFRRSAPDPGRGGDVAEVAGPVVVEQHVGRLEPNHEQVEIPVAVVVGRRRRRRAADVDPGQPHVPLVGVRAGLLGPPELERHVAGDEDVEHPVTVEVGDDDAAPDQVAAPPGREGELGRVLHVEAAVDPRPGIGAGDGTADLERVAVGQRVDVGVGGVIGVGRHLGVGRIARVVGGAHEIAVGRRTGGQEDRQERAHAAPAPVISSTGSAAARPGSGTDSPERQVRMWA